MDIGGEAVQKAAIRAIDDAPTIEANLNSSDDKKEDS